MMMRRPVAFQRCRAQVCRTKRAECPSLRRVGLSNHISLGPTNHIVQGSSTPGSPSRTPFLSVSHSEHDSKPRSQGQA